MACNLTAELLVTSISDLANVANRNNVVDKNLSRNVSVMHRAVLSVINA